MIDFNAFFKISYGLYVVASGSKDKNNCFIANAAFQVTAEPARFAVCCNKDNFSSDIIKHTGAFSLSVLHENASMEFIGTAGYKSGRDLNKLSGIPHFFGETGVPIVTENCVAYMECTLEQTFEVGTHYIFIGRVLTAKVHDNENTPITYDYYRNVKRGFAPKNAPTYVDKNVIEAPTKNDAQTEQTHDYKCLVCGYLYKETTHNEFNNLPDSWKCPICGVGKEDFNII